MSLERVEVRQRSRSDGNIQIRHDLPEQLVNGQAQPLQQDQGQSVQETIRQQSAVFTEAKEEGRSEEFLEVKRALEDYDGELRFGTGQFTKYLRLHEALTVYIESHRNAGSEAGIERLAAAVNLRRALDLTAKKMLKDNGAVIEKNEQIEADKKEQKAAAQNVVDMLDHYQRYCRKLTEDMLSSREEKLRSRWNVFKTCEKDILLFLQGKDDGFDRERIFLRSEYDTLRLHLSLFDLAREKGEEDALKTDMTDKIRDRAFREMTGENAPEKQEQQLDSGDAVLRKEQEKGLSEIDAWVLRNIGNGGYMSLGLNTSDRTDFATRLLSLPKRQRLYIYYLVETRERIAPQPDGFARSQTVYEPNLKKFKDHMVASAAKFYTRFSGSYIYWGKLTEAMAIAGTAAEACDMMEEIKREENKPQEEPVEGPLLPEEMRRKTLKNLLKNLSRAVDIAAEKEKTKVKAVQQALDAQLKELADERAGFVEEFNRIQEKITAAKGKRRSDIKSTINNYTSTAPMDVGTVVGIAKEGVKEFAGTETAVLAAIDQYGTVAENSLKGLGTFMGLVFSAMKLWSGHSAMTNLDFIGGIAGVAKSIAATAKNVGTVGIQVSKASAFQYMTKAGVSTGLGYAWMGIAAVKGMSYLKDGSRRCKASKLAKGKDPDKYSEGMLRLNRILGKKQLTNVSLEGLAAGTSFAVPTLIAASILTSVFGVITAGAVFAVLGAQKIFDSKYRSKMGSQLNEAFFGIDELVKEAEEDWKAKHQNKPMSDAQKEKLKKQIQKRMAAELGYYSSNHMARSVAEKYAAYLLDGAAKDDEHAKMCRAMIRGLGLYYKRDAKKPEKTVPKISDLVSKMCG